MGKRGKNQIGNRNSKKMNRGNGMEDMDDEIDVFHKHRDKVSLDVNDEVGDTDEEEEFAVFDYKDIHEDDEEEEEDEDEDNDDHPNSLVKKIQRTQKLLKAKHGDLGDDMLDDTEDKEVEHVVWSRRKSLYYDGDNADYELQSSDEDSAQEEEAEVIRLRKEAATSMTVEDVGIEESDESDIEPTLEEMLIKGKDASGSSQKKEIEDGLSVPYEMVKKDLDSLSRDEAMDVVYSSAPELVGLLSELNDALEQLEISVNPLLVKVQNVPVKKEGSQYLEVKKQLLLFYCQAITFYLLLKSEGQPVRDHPVIARLVEIKSLLDKMKELDVNLPSQLEELLEENKTKLIAQSAVKNSTALSDLVSKMKDHEQVSAVELEASKLEREPQIVNISKDDAQKVEDVQSQNENVISKQSLKMLSARAALEEKLKQKGVFTTIEPGAQGTKRRKLQPLNSKLETFDDFDDDAMDADENPSELFGNAPTLSNRVSQYLSVKGNKTKVSGDDDLPKRDDLGERRRKYELQVLARAGVKSMDKDDDNGAEPVSEEDEGRNNADADVGSDESDKSEDEFYGQVKQQRNLRLAAKALKYTRTRIAPQGPELTLDGKRHITTQIEKNRGLTRNRKKLIKNPRKKYKLKHDKAMKRRAGQVRKVVRPEGPYSGEWTGINANISRSIRLSG